MKKIITVLLISLLSLGVVGCGEAENKQGSAEQQNQKVVKDEPNQEELDQKLKTEAVKADFVELNSSPNQNIDKKVFVKGEITNVMKPGEFGNFTVTTKEGEGFGMYSVENYGYLDQPVLDEHEGKTATVWGMYNGKDDMGMPEILASIVELEYTKSRE